MKKRLLACALAAVFTLALLAGCSRKSESPGPEDAGQKEETGLTEVTLNEVAHSIFYAPMYAAVEEGYFAEEGIDLDLVCGFGDNMLGKDDDVKMVQYSAPELMPRGVVMYQPPFLTSSALLESTLMSTHDPAPVSTSPHCWAVVPFAVNTWIPVPSSFLPSTQSRRRFLLTTGISSIGLAKSGSYPSLSTCCTIHFWLSDPFFS